MSTHFNLPVIYFSLKNISYTFYILIRSIGIIYIIEQHFIDAQLQRLPTKCILLSSYKKQVQHFDAERKYTKLRKAVIIIIPYLILTDH